MNDMTEPTGAPLMADLNTLIDQLKLALKEDRVFDAETLSLEIHAHTIAMGATKAPADE